MRRRLARSLNELDDQVEWHLENRATRASIEKLKKDFVADCDRQLNELDRMDAPILRFIERFYFARRSEFTESKTIKLPSGRSVGARSDTKIKLTRSEPAVFAAIVRTGQWKKFFRKPELNRTALKKDPEGAAKVGVRLVPSESLVFTPAP